MVTNHCPHDAFFKKFLGDISVARDFLQIHLPTSIIKRCDWGTLKICPTSYVDDNMRNYHSDMLYSVNMAQDTGYIYCLIEHQSRPDKLIAFRQLRYSLAAMQGHLDLGFNQLPVVIPLLFYQGKRPFTGSTDWLDCFADRALARKIYSNPYLLVDVTLMSDRDIMSHRRVALFELVQKHIRQRDMATLAEDIGTLLYKWPLSLELNNSLVYYISQAGDTDDVKGFFNQLARQAPRYQESIMTIAQKLEQIGRQEGMQEGMQEGLQKGRREGIYMVARHLLGSGVDRALVKASTQLTDEELDQLA
ncbi:Rpn family recombination-promoting nuclease/putative transposase [Acerihabitans sp.]|uniref:Rpn family recombination-promoting nuclease/putative transposase n=1 Tax=Acerihabitans sp. TaxID=2811394 RepID=UPI002ED9BB4B